MRSATRNKIGKDPDYLAFIRDFPCILCLLIEEGATQRESDLQRAGLLGVSRVQMSQTEAAHVGDRGLSQKCPDNEAIPLCREHHREGKFSAHKLGKKFWTRWGIGRDEIIQILQHKYDAHCGVVP